MSCSGRRRSRRRRALDMIDSLATQKLLGEFRGEPAVDRDTLTRVLVGLGRLATERTDVASVDINPLIVGTDGIVIAVDALVELASQSDGGQGDAPASARPAPTDAQFRALFEPRGVLVTGASSHPGKFGFVSLHNLLASGYAGGVYGTNLKGEEVLGIKTVADIDDLPDGEIDLVFVCTPAAANPDLLRACAAQGNPGGVPDLRRVRRSGRRRTGRRERARRPRRRARNPAGRAQRPGRGEHAGHRSAPRSSPRIRRPARSGSPARAATSCRRSSTCHG